MSLLLLFNPQVVTGAAYLRPAADSVNTANWVTQAGSSSGLFDAIDESVTGDSDYILSPAANLGGAGLWPVLLRLSDPAAGKTFVEPVKVRYRYRKTNTGDKMLIVTLKQGATQIAQWSHTGAGITTSFQTVTQTLTAPQALGITDYNNLFIEFTDDEV
jgi:hypothetical protein